MTTRAHSSRSYQWGPVQKMSNAFFFLVPCVFLCFLTAATEGSPDGAEPLADILFFATVPVLLKPLL